MNFAAGDRLAVLERDVEGLRVREATVYATDGDRVGYFVNTTDESLKPTSELRWARVDSHGMSLDRTDRELIIPMDEVIEAEIAKHGEGYLVRPSQRDLFEIAENEEEAAAQIQARRERMAQEQSEGHGYGY